MPSTLRLARHGDGFPFDSPVFMEKLCPILFGPFTLQISKHFDEPVFDTFRPRDGYFLAAILIACVAALNDGHAELLKCRRVFVSAASRRRNVIREHESDHMISEIG